MFNIADDSNVRNNNFTALVLEKFDAHRQLCETNAANFGKLWAEKMSTELCLADEQMTLVESVMSQSIVGVREFNENLLNEIVQPMLNVITEQNAKLMAKESLMFEMVS